MCFPVYKMIDSKWKLNAVYLDFAKLMDEWDMKFGEGFCWEPWSVDMPFHEAWK
jgi:hypothetical protein